MLRMLFGEPARKAEGALAEAFEWMERFVRLMNERISAGKDGDHKLRTYELWTIGLMAALDELEQSRYAARRFASRVRGKSLAQMPEEERLDYYRHVYFDKNAFIRVFAILDKLGTFMNDLFGLETEKMKSRFSYFTVLRGMRQRNLHPALTTVLGKLKDSNREPMANLRKRRNIEVHYMNTELMDDLVQSHQSYGTEFKLENLESHMRDLDQAFAMVAETLRSTFEYAVRLPKMNR
ncbi:MAG TPA: Cthe_2314 family HEPN domain-containing protein [Paenibacillus sp.]|uniref:Cthe_2314 family HEPN domain-containing protein n=1 Tax=Paenibacillus sp. TaxID=58172 RepID=UPI0028D61CE1|nr:Cthe_2314 family HEPN domain-containing protein [Paenibacillus sp.]HUC93960.1 Cthe_2314 family HEPN domain-containing protein [Paenibacillus sp.]